VQDALGDAAGARASYRRYLQLVGAYNRRALAATSEVRPAPPKRPLEPFFLKRADRYLAEQIDAPFTIADLAHHCGVSLRTLEKAMVDNRGVTPVAHVRNVRLDQARSALEAGDDAVADVAHRLGF